MILPKAPQLFFFFFIVSALIISLRGSSISRVKLERMKSGAEGNGQAAKLLQNKEGLHKRTSRRLYRKTSVRFAVAGQGRIHH